jgi:hypothetical protein
MGNSKRALTALAVVLLFMTLITTTVAVANEYRTNSFEYTQPEAIHKKNQLIKEVLQTKAKLEKMKKKEIEEKKAAEYERLADDLVASAATEKNQTLKMKQLQMAQEIIRSPIKTIKSLEARLAKKAKAKEALDKAKAEKDPKVQAKLLEEAEALVVEFKTGKKPKMKEVVDEDADLVTMDEVNGLFGEELVRFSEQVAAKLIKKANSVTDAGYRNATLAIASGILQEPKKNLREYVRVEDIKRKAKKMVMKMRKSLGTEMNPKIRQRIKERIGVLEKDPVGFHDNLLKKEKEKIVVKANALAKKIIQQAEKEKDEKKAEAVMEEARRYIHNPFAVMASLSRAEMREKYLQSARPECKPYIAEVYKLGQTPMERIFEEIVKPPPKPPVTGIVNMAQVGMTNLGQTGTSTVAMKKMKAIDEDFNVEKNYIKISFTGWMKRNSELKDEGNPKKSASLKTKAKPLTAKESGNKKFELAKKKKDGKARKLRKGKIIKEKVKKVKTTKTKMIDRKGRKITTTKTKVTKKKTTISPAKGAKPAKKKVTKTTTTKTTVTKTPNLSKVNKKSKSMAKVNKNKAKKISKSKVKKSQKTAKDGTKTKTKTKQTQKVATK